MPVDVFDKTIFDKALPVSQRASSAFPIGTALWRTLGLVQGEWCYVIHVKDGVDILIRSSIRADGLSAGAGEDSIRHYIVDDIDRKPLMTKERAKDFGLPRYTTRVHGWEGRLTEALRALWKLGRMLGTCPSCKVFQLHFRKVKKSGVNKGRLFVTCDCGKHFKWADGGAPL